MRKSWKPSERSQTSGVHRLVGDFVNEDHLFIGLMINHRVQPLDLRLALRGCCARLPDQGVLQNPHQSIDQLQLLKASGDGKATTRSASAGFLSAYDFGQLADIRRDAPRMYAGRGFS